MSDDQVCGRCGLSTGILLDLDTGGGPCHPEPWDCIHDLRDEIARLRAALEEIAEHSTSTVSRERARRALNGEAEHIKGPKAPNRTESTLSVPSDGEVERLESRVDDIFSATERDAAATRCWHCGAPYQVVRPGKIQPTCECDYHA